MKFTFIQEQGHRSMVSPGQWEHICRILGVSRSGYAAWCRQRSQAPTPPPTPRQQEKQQAEARLRLQIRAAYRTGRHYYGSARVYDELREQGLKVSRKRVARLMREEELVGRSRARRRVATTDSRHAQLVANNLLERRFAPQQIERPTSKYRFWCGNIT
jgi:putative transposase